MKKDGAQDLLDEVYEKFIPRWANHLCEKYPDGFNFSSISHEDAEKLFKDLMHKGDVQELFVEILRSFHGRVVTKELLELRKSAIDIDALSGGTRNADDVQKALQYVIDILSEEKIFKQLERVLMSLWPRSCPGFFIDFSPIYDNILLMETPLILATTQSFIRVVEVSDLKKEIEMHGLSFLYNDLLKLPFSFDPENVFAIVAGESKIGEDEIKIFPNLKIIARFGRGLDNIDLGAAKKRGVLVTTASYGSTRSVAEHTIGLMFALARNIAESDCAMKRDVWNRGVGVELRGKTLGIIGFGNIGKKVAELAVAFGMSVVVFDPSYQEKVFGASRTDLSDLLKSADIVSLHIPLTEQTRWLINKQTLGLMKPTAFLINTARGEVINEKALLDALENKALAGAALDVFSEEPPFHNALLKKIIAHPSVIATPHVASFTSEAQHEVAKTVWGNILAVKEGRTKDISGWIR